MPVRYIMLGRQDIFKIYVYLFWILGIVTELSPFPVTPFFKVQLYSPQNYNHSWGNLFFAVYFGECFRHLAHLLKVKNLICLLCTWLITVTRPYKHKCTVITHIRYLFSMYLYNYILLYISTIIPIRYEYIYQWIPKSLLVLISISFSVADVIKYGRISSNLQQSVVAQPGPRRQSVSLQQSQQLQWQPPLPRLGLLRLQHVQTERHR